MLESVRRQLGAERQDRIADRARTLERPLQLVAPFLDLPGLRGLWYAGNVDENNDLRDFTGQGRTLSDTAAPGIGFYNTLVPYFDYNGTTQYHSRADEAGLDITGPLTVGGWVWFDNPASGAAQVLASKAGAAGNITHAVYCSGAAVPSCYVSSDGTALTTHTLATTTFAANAWNWFVMRYTPSAELKLYVNADASANTTAIPAAIFNSTAAFVLAATAVPGSYLNGRIPISFLCAQAVGDGQILGLRQATRGLFGV